MGKRLTVWVDGREALPVRAIPYVAAWRPGSAPDGIVRTLAVPKTRRVGSRVGSLEIRSRHNKLFACQMDSQGHFEQVPPEQWEQFVVALDCLTKKLTADERRGAKGENYDEWRNAAVLKLPDDVFIWLDEFQRWYSTTRPLKDTDDYLKWEHNQERLNAKRQEPGSVLTESEWNELDASPPEMQEDACLCLSPILPPEIENKLWRFGELTPAVEAPAEQDEYVSALLLLAPYWDKPACELPENLREIASPLWDMATPEGRQNLARQHDTQHDPALHWLWYDCSMDARTWWGLKDIAPREAAMLLCRLNPLECEREDPERIYVDDDKSSPKRYRLLLLTFEDVAKVTPQTRTLSQWLGIARDKQLQYHPWIDEYERGISLVMLTETPAAPMEKAPLVAPPETNASEQAANNRKNHDITKERGCRRHILDNWDDIEKLHGAAVDGRRVHNLLKRRVDASELPTLKTVQNKLKLLRDEILIP